MSIGLDKKVNIDVYRQRVAQGIFKSFSLGNMPYNFLYKFEQGYDFYLKGFYFSHPAQSLPNGAVILYKLMVEFIRNIRSRPLQNDPYPCRLVSSPGGNGAIGGPNIGAAAKLGIIEYNEPYVFAEVLEARFTWHTIQPGSQIPVEVFMFGYLVPENSLSMWE